MHRWVGRSWLVIGRNHSGQDYRLVLRAGFNEAAHTFLRERATGMAGAEGSFRRIRLLAPGGIVAAEWCGRPVRRVGLAR